MESRAATRSLKADDEEEAEEEGRPGGDGGGSSSSEIALSASAAPSRGSPFPPKSLKCAARGAECEKSLARASERRAESARLLRAASPEKRSEGQ